MSFSEFKQFFLFLKQSLRDDEIAQVDKFKSEDMSQAPNSYYIIMISSQMIKSTTQLKTRQTLDYTEESNVESTQPFESRPRSQKRYKSLRFLVMHILVLSLSSFYFGYIMGYLSSINFGTIMNVYSITIQQQLAQGLLAACIPIGGGLGALVCGCSIQKLSRINNLLLINVFALFAGCIIYIPRFELLIVARLIQGMCAGAFSAAVPLVMKQLSPTEISGTLTSFNQIFIATGLLFAFIFSLILSAALKDPFGEKIWWIVFGFPIITSLLQSFLLTCVYHYQTPKYLFQTGHQQKGRQLIERIYKQEYVEEVIRELKMNLGQQVDRNNLGDKTEIQPLESQRPVEVERKQVATPKTAVVVAIHLAALQQFCGINAVLGYGGGIVGGNNPTLNLVLPIFINFEQVIGAIFASYLLSVVGRKSLLQIGSFMACISCAVIAGGFFLTQASPGLSIVLIVFGVVLFMANFGFTLGPVVWVYLPEIVQPKVMPYATMVNWASAAIIILLFPVVMQRLPDKNPAILFLFFALWSTLSFLFNKKFVIETKNKGQKQISNEYQKGNQIQQV